MTPYNPFAFIVTHPWAYPVLEVAHILGIALLVGNLVALEARVWGAARALDVQVLARLSLTLAVLGFGLAAFTGSLMFASQPWELLANRAFLVKLGLITLAACNAAWFHTRGSLARCDGIARALMVVSTLLWLGVMGAGRWIAYV